MDGLVDVLVNEWGWVFIARLDRRAREPRALHGTKRFVPRILYFSPLCPVVLAMDTGSASIGGGVWWNGALRDSEMSGNNVLKNKTEKRTRAFSSHLLRMREYHIHVILLCIHTRFPFSKHIQLPRHKRFRVIFDLEFSWI